jgi:hypothetical protein
VIGPVGVGVEVGNVVDEVGKVVGVVDDVGKVVGVVNDAGMCISEDFGHRRPSSITHLKDMIASLADEEDKANANYDAICSKSKQNTGGGSNNNGNQGGRSNNYSSPNRKRKPDNTIAAIQRPAKDNSKEDLRRLQRLAEREVSVASGRQPHHRAVLPTPASTQGYYRATAPSRQERQEEDRRMQR